MYLYDDFPYKEKFLFPKKEKNSVLHYYKNSKTFTN